MTIVMYTDVPYLHIELSRLLCICTFISWRVDSANNINVTNNCLGALQSSTTKPKFESNVYDTETHR